MVFIAGLNKAGFRSRTHCMAGHSNTRCRSSWRACRLHCWHKRWARGTPLRRPSTIGNEWLPHPETQQCVHAASTKRLHHQKDQAAAILLA